MKDKLNKAFSHKLDVFGKTIPTALVAMLLIGGGSAALVTTFVSVQGTGTVQNQAISATTPTAFDYNANAAPETFVDTLTIQNNNQNVSEVVDFQWTTSKSASKGGDTQAQTVNVFDISKSQTQATTKETEVSYNKAEDEVHFTVNGVTDYSNGNGVVLGFDTNNDGTYEFQVDTASSGIQPDYYRYKDGSWFNDDSYDWTQEALEEYRGVFFTNASTELQNKDSFTLTVDAERLGSEFRYEVQADGSFLQDGDASGDGVEANPGINVTDSTESLDGNETGDYLVVTELSSVAPSGDYTTTANANPVAQ